MTVISYVSSLKACGCGLEIDGEVSCALTLVGQHKSGECLGAGSDLLGRNAFMLPIVSDQFIGARQTSKSANQATHTRYPWSLLDDRRAEASMPLQEIREFRQDLLVGLS